MTASHHRQSGQCAPSPSLSCITSPEGMTRPCLTAATQHHLAPPSHGLSTALTVCHPSVRPPARLFFSPPIPHPCPTDRPTGRFNQTDRASDRIAIMQANHARTRRDSSIAVALAAQAGAPISGRNVHGEREGSSNALSQWTNQHWSWAPDRNATIVSMAIHAIGNAGVPLSIANGIVQGYPNYLEPRHVFNVHWMPPGMGLHNMQSGFLQMFNLYVPAGQRMAKMDDILKVCTKY